MIHQSKQLPRRKVIYQLNKSQEKIRQQVKKVPIEIPYLFISARSEIVIVEKMCIAHC